MSCFFFFFRLRKNERKKYYGCDENEFSVGEVFGDDDEL